MLLPLFGNRKEDVTEENIQSRARGVTLMAVSNKLGGMVVTTGNKSEMAMGYATLYGDMAGGYNVLKDVYKTTVFELCRWRNAHLPEGAMGPKGRVIPERIITKPPSAELRADQKDEDSLPPYPVLDAILKGLIERDLGARGAGGGRPRPRHREPRVAPAGGRRVQAPPGAARREDHLAPHQQGAALSDRQRLSRVGNHVDRPDHRHARQAAGRAALQAHRHRGFPRAGGGARECARSAARHRARHRRSGGWRQARGIRAVSSGCWRRSPCRSI